MARSIPGRAASARQQAAVYPEISVQQMTMRKEAPDRIQTLFLSAKTDDAICSDSLQNTGVF
jgi:hypothetical protein